MASSVGDGERRSISGRRPAPERRIRPRRDQVRIDLRQAATEHFLAVGYRAARLDAIAQIAGYTKGAIYSNFTSKQDLFLELLDERLAAFAAASGEDLAAASTIDDLVSILTGQLAREVLTETEWHLLVVEFAVEAVKDERASIRYAALRAARRDDVTSRLRGLRPDVPERAARAAATALFAAVNGLALEVAVDRAAFSEPQIAAALRATLAIFLTPRSDLERGVQPSTL